MKQKSFIALWILIALGSSEAAIAQQSSGREFRRSAVMNGNQVRTVFGNWGVIGQPAEQGYRGAWKDNNNGYLGDVSPLVGAEVISEGKLFHSVVTSPVARPTTRRDEDPLTGKPWTFEPVSGYFNANIEKVAMSNDKNSWPPTWPDKMNDGNDPGWPRSWNGYFGKRINADLETYYVMDDQNDERFSLATNNIFGVSFKSDSLKPSRNGLGLEMRVRALQWAQFLAKDNIFWLYEITNTSTTDYNRTVFGMLVGTYIGVTSTENYQEYDDDWSFFDVATNITYTGDWGRSTNNPLWVGPIGMVGYAFLESPGNPYDGIDNDGDADSSLIGLGAPKFAESDFDSTLIRPNSQIVLINDDFSRVLYRVPAVDSVRITTRGLTQWIKPGKTKVAEGNLYSDRGVVVVNPNSYDGIDNDYDGLIDESYYLHYRQVKILSNGSKPFDILRPVRYINYFTNIGKDPRSMIDERRNDLIDNNGDWNLLHDDVGRDGVKGTGDYGEGDGFPTSGYNANGTDSGLPGEPHIDKTDVRESDQIGLTSFYYFTPANNFVMGDDEAMWRYLAPGFFDVPSNIDNNRPTGGRDGDFIYGSGFFPLRAKTTERFSLALVYGGGKGGSIDDDINDLLKNKKTVQKIYDANYQFPQPPDIPTLTAVPGDGVVTLYWDRKAEESVDPVLNIKDFEGYKIYKSTDPTFKDIFTITDGSGSAQGYRPLKQFDVKNGVKGYFPTTGELYNDVSGFAYYLGDDTGIQHSFVDNDVQNGRKYYYAVVAYDRGDQFSEIMPSENNIYVAISPTGVVDKGSNVAIVTPNGKVAGYVPPKDGVELTRPIKYGTGKAYYHVLDETQVTGHKYQVEFLDTQVDTVDNNMNFKTDLADSTEWERLTSFYTVKDLSQISEEFISLDTTVIRLNKQNLIPGTVSIFDSRGTSVASTRYTLNSARGEIRGKTAGSLPAEKYTIKYQYYPVYRSPFIKGSPFVGETKDADIFDGVELVLNNDWQVRKDEGQSRWIGNNAYVYNFITLNVELFGKKYVGYAKPSDYEIQFANSIVDTSYGDPDLFPDQIPVNFRIYDLTDSVYTKFIFVDSDFNGKLSPVDQIIIMSKNPRGQLNYTWRLLFLAKMSDPIDTIYALGAGDKLQIRTTKPFRQGDVFEFTTTVPTVAADQARAQLSKIRVVPNPYVSASTLEPPLDPGVTLGRKRRIDFVHLPAGASIQIFTSRGEHVITLQHSGTMEDGTVTWNLKTKENLDIAFGVYFYVVESTVGAKTGKFAIIK
ncbi:MAG: hypothetical protein V1799_12695 [bacterium]